MVCLTRKRIKFYKLTMLDIWGHSLIYKKPTKEVTFVRLAKKQDYFRRKYYKKQFLYSFKRRIRFEKIKRLEPEFLLPRYLKYFYLILKMSNFRRFYKKAARKMDAFDSNLMIFLECRLFMVAYRLNFINNMFMIRSTIQFGIMHVNGIVKYHSNTTISVGDVVGLANKYRELIRKDMIIRFRKKIIFWNIPAYYHMNYKFLMAIFWADPLYEDIDMFYLAKYKRPRPLDIFIGSEYYSPRVY